MILYENKLNQFQKDRVQEKIIRASFFHLSYTNIYLYMKYLNKEKSSKTYQCHNVRDDIYNH